MAAGKKKNGLYWSDAKKIEVVTTFLVVGNAPMTEAITGVSRETIKKWKLTDWWKEIEREIQDEENIELSAKLKKIVDKSIDVTMDRLENGDTIFNPKTGELLRVPVKVREALKAVDMAIDKRQVLQNKPTRITETRTIDDRLNKLAEEFKRFANATEINTKALKTTLEPISDEIEVLVSTKEENGSEGPLNDS